MGIAIILILICHNTIVFPHGVVENANNMLKSWATIGVDIFLICSGMGCYYSLHKSQSIAYFYKKRVCRIIPVYIIIIGFWIFIQTITHRAPLLDLLRKYSIHTFFTEGNVTEWYIPAILILYLITPFLYRLLLYRKNAFIFTGLFVAAVALVLSFSQYKTVRVINAFFISRIHTYMLGMIIANCLVSNRNVTNKWNDTCYREATFILLIVVYIINYLYNMWNYTVIEHVLIFPAMAVTMLFLVTAKLKDGKKSVTDRMGAYTLEIYLCHDKFYQITSELSTYLFDERSFIISCLDNMAAVVMSVGFSYVISCGYSWIRNEWYGNKG